MLFLLFCFELRGKLPAEPADRSESLEFASFQSAQLEEVRRKQKLLNSGDHYITKKKALEEACLGACGQFV
jgi:hypothetical protein